MKWLYGIICLVFLILFHEFGHFLACKLFGVKVEAFSIGFGPVLFHKKIKGTDFRLSLLPLGGYCGMKGDKEFQEALENNYSEIKAGHDSLYGVHSIKKALIAFAGPLFNFIFAFLSYTIIAFAGYYYYTYSNTILIPEEAQCKIAKDAGLQNHDVILKINNVSTSDFSEIVQEISVRPDENISVLVNRNNELLTFNMVPELDSSTGSGRIGISADTSTLTKKQSPKYNIFQSIGKGFLDSCNTIYLTIKGIGTLFKGADIESSVSGPLRITEMLGSTIKLGFSENLRQGFINILSLMAIISISLFIMNLLPLPVLDGGLILISILECVSRKKIHPKIQYYIQFIGLAFILILFIIGIKGDLHFLLKK